MTPYAVIKCHLWHSPELNGRRGTAPANAARMFQIYPEAFPRVMYRHRNMSRAIHDGVQITMHGWATLYPRKAVVLVRCAATGILAHALCAARNARNVITKMATPLTMTLRTSRYFVAVAIWLRTVV